MLTVFRLGCAAAFRACRLSNSCASMVIVTAAMHIAAYVRLLQCVSKEPTFWMLSAGRQGP